MFLSMRIHHLSSVFLVLSLAACVPEGSTGQPIRKSVIYVGDSIAVETRSVLGTEMAAANLRFAHSVKGGMAICDYFPEVEAEGGAGTFRTWDGLPNLHDLVVSAKPGVVVMQFWGNSWQYTPCMNGPDDVALAPGSDAYFDHYAADAERAMVIIRDAAASANISMPTVSWVLQGPDKGRPTRPERLNAIYTALAARWDTADVIDAGHEVSLAANYYEPGSRYGFTQWLPCTTLERDTDHCDPSFGGVAKIHKDDDDVHFCLGAVNDAGVCDTWSPGIYRFALAISASVKDALTAP